MEQINQFPEQVSGSGQNKFKIISIILATLVFILALALVFSILQKEKSLPLINNDQVQKTNTDSQDPAKSATVDEKKKMGLPDVSNIEIVSRDSNGLPTAYKILKGPNFIDSDNDSLTDADEIKFGTDKNSLDTDGDGISDWQELSQGTNPLVKDDFNTKK